MIWRESQIPPESGLDVKDENGRLFIKEMLDMKSGVIHYLWKGTAASASDSVLQFATFDPFAWIIATRADQTELSLGVIAVGRVVLIAGVALLLLLPLLIYIVVQRVVTRPLAELRKRPGNAVLNWSCESATLG